MAEPMPAIVASEEAVMSHLVQAWNGFALLPQTHPTDADEFMRAIHLCQRILATRQMRRIDPEKWPTKMADEGPR